MNEQSSTGTSFRDSKPQPVLSIVSTLYYSDQFLPEFIARCQSAMDQFGKTAELILVDDGSPDRSLETAMFFAKKDPRIVVVSLSRNFGHHAAILTGLAQCRGELIFFVDSDLEEDPALVSQFHDVMIGEKVDVVFGIHDQIVGSKMRRLSSSLFWKLFNILSEIKTPPNICNIRLMNRNYVEALLSMPERSVFLGGMFVWAGFKQRPFKVVRSINRAESTYNLTRRLALMISSLVSFSSKPLHLLFWVGNSISIVSFLVAIFYFIAKIMNPASVLSGFTAIIISVWFLSGLIIASIGLVGLYISYIYREVKARPRTIVSSIYQSDGNNDGAS